MVHELKIYLLCVCFVILHLEKKQFEKTPKIIHKVKLDFSVCFAVQNLEKNQYEETY